MALESQLERGIRGQIAAAFVEVDASALSVTITCPPNIQPADEPATVRCSAEVDGQVVDMDVIVGGPNGADAVEASIVEPMVSALQVEQLLAANFGADLGVPTSVSCPNPVMFLRSTDAMNCEATDPLGTTRVLRVTVDAAGEVGVTLAG